MKDDDIAEIEDVGDVWLAFWASALFAGLGAFALLRFTGVLEPWTMIVAVTSGVAVGWIVASIRPARAFVSGLVQLLAFPWW